MHSDPRSFTLYDVLERCVRNHPNACALVDTTDPEDHQEWTFRAFAQRVDQLAGGLEQRGFEPGDRLAVLALNSVEFAALYFVAARNGMVLVPINWRLQPAEIDLLWQRTAPKAIFVDTANRATLAATQAAASCEHRFLLDGEATADEIVSSKISAEPGPRPPIGDDEPVAIIATAAVDVIPRGALLSHRNLIASNLQEIAALGIGPGDASLLALPLFHIAALGHFLAFLHAGARNVLMPRFDAGEAIRHIAQYEVTHFSDFPPVLSQILDAAATSKASSGTDPLRTLRFVTGLDSPDTMARLHEQTGACFWTGFGQTETSGFVTLQNARERMGTTGRPGELCAVETFDDADRPVGRGKTGEIVVRGPLVFLGYDAQPDVTAATFRGGWHHTGDLGRIEDDGRLTYVGRKPEKELIKPGGENVYPAEVEAVLVQIPGVSAACVLGIPDSKWGEGILAVLEVKSDFALDLEAVRTFVGERIAGFKRPHRVETTQALPRDEHGTIDRTSVKHTWVGS